MKHICTLFVMFIVFSITSCQKVDSLTESKTSPEVESGIVASNLQNRSAQISTFTIPKGWTSVKSTKGVQLLKNGGDYIVVANLKEGAKFGMVFDSLANRGGADAKFRRKSFGTWNKYGTFFACANSIYFNAQEDPTRIPFPLKQNGIIYGIGNGGSNSDRTREKATLNIDDVNKSAEVLTIGSTYLDYTKLRTRKAYVGFTYKDGNVPNSATKRTFVGIKDVDGDGKKETILLFVSGTAKTHKNAVNILISSFSCSSSDIVTFDGGGSSQLLCPSYKKGYLVGADTRNLPAAFVVKAAE